MVKSIVLRQQFKSISDRLELALKISSLRVETFTISCVLNTINMPPSKKQRIDAAQDADDTNDMPSKSHIIKSNTNTTKLLEQHRDTLKTLKSNISELAADTSNTSTNRGELLLSSSIALSTLKSLQRQISLSVEAHANTSKVHREAIEECSLTLENLNYERNYLCDEISSMKSWKADELEKMSWKELGLDPAKLKKGKDVGDKMEEDDKVTTAEEAIDTYLLGDNSTTQSKSHRDPSNHTLILNKLQSNLKTRSTLVQQLSQSKKQLKELQKKRDTYRNFLNQIPKKLVELEKVGESLNNFFSGSNVWKDVLNDTSNDGDTAMGDDVDDDAKMKKVQDANLLVSSPSFDRTKRFELAQSNLPSPLYVLYVQLVGYLDAWASLEKLGGSNAAASTAVANEGDNKKSTALDGFVGANGMNVSAVPPEEASDGTAWNVALTLSSGDILPPEISSILGKNYANSRSTTASSIKIVFSYIKEEGVVYASVNDDDGGSNEGLLDNLFPGDDGNANPNVSLSVLKDEDDEETSSDEGEEQTATKSDNGSKNGKPYYWCQVLSGLNFPPPSSSSTVVSDEKESDAQFKIQTCTKAVFRQLLRRIRARKTLAAILEYLNKRSQLHALPIHPTMKGEDQPQSIKTKLHSWAEDSKDKSTTTKSYVATIKRKSSTLKATAVIDTQKYPAEPPVWSLQNEDGSSGTLSSWGEEHGSVSSLQQNAANSSSSNGAPPLFDAGLHRIECHVNEGLDKFVRQDVEHTYDWILLHQLADIVACWDEVISASEGSGNSRGKGEMMSGRMHKGKDRRLVSFGERSPFSWYRNGL